MGKWQQRSTAEQLADYLRQEIKKGRWHSKMPGVIRLADELGVARNSVEAALKELERTGLLRSEGRGRGRTIDQEAGHEGARGLKVGILAYEPSDRAMTDTVELINDLDAAGHTTYFANRTLIDLGHQPSRVARVVEATPADAWVVFAGSREVLAWFTEYHVPTFAYAGRASRLPIATICPEKTEPVRAMVHRLVELGHQRIVLLVRENRRKPEPGIAERAFLKALKDDGISTGPYNLPDWEETPEGFHAGLESLFRFTPPTAMVIDEAPFVFAAFQFCLAKGLKIPGDVSIISSDPSMTFDWCNPSIAHIAWDHRPCVRRIVRWANNISQGKEDIRQSYSKAEFVEGGTIGPAPQ